MLVRKGWRGGSEDAGGIPFRSKKVPREENVRASVFSVFRVPCIRNTVGCRCYIRGDVTATMHFSRVRHLARFPSDRSSSWIDRILLRAGLLARQTLGALCFPFVQQPTVAD